jgi:hypothetical protein
MASMIALGLAAGAVGIAAEPSRGLLDGAESVCLAAGYCPAAVTGEGPGGVMFLTLGILGAGVAMLRSDSERARRARQSGDSNGTR